jgi:hypothetical protein
MVPTRVLLRFVTRRVEVTDERRLSAPLDVDRIVRTIRSAARLVPRASCLTQALAGQLLLASNGIRSDLRIGVCRSDPGGLAAHAWVEVDGVVVLGGGEHQKFVRLPQLSPIVSR